MLKTDKAMKIMILSFCEINNWKTDCMQLSIIHIQDLLRKNSINYLKYKFALDRKHYRMYNALKLQL